MKCNQCGTDYEGKFCPNCGAPAANVTQQGNNAQPAANFNQTQYQPMGKVKKPVYKKWWFWVIIAVVVIAVIANFVGAGDETPTKESGSSSESSEKDETFKLNDTAVFDSIKVTANDLKESKGTEFFVPEEGNIFVGVQFTIENTSEEDQEISSILLFDAYVDGVKCDYSISATSVFSDGTLDGTIAAGKKMVGYYAVEIPANWKELELQVQSSWLSDAKAAFVFNKK